MYVCMYVCIGMTCLAPSAFFSTSLNTIVLPRPVRSRNKFQGIWSSPFCTRYLMAFTTCTPTGCCTGTLWVVWGIHECACTWCSVCVHVYVQVCMRAFEGVVWIVKDCALPGCAHQFRQECSEFRSWAASLVPASTPICLTCDKVSDVSKWLHCCH